MDGQVSAAPLQLQGWLPAGTTCQDGQLLVDWLHFGEEQLGEAFFADDVRRVLRQPYNQLFSLRTPMAALAEWQQRQPGLPPNGFIFHMSRCGSTLVAQMLAALPRNIVVSEAAPIDAVLRARQTCPGLAQEEQLRWLQWVISAFGQPRSGGERHLFIKFDSWHVLDLALIRRAFPAVPWIFLYRDPVEVMVSHMNRRGSQMVPGIVSPLQYGIDPAEGMAMPAHEYCARVLEVICQAVLHHCDDGAARLVNYAQLPRALDDVVMPHFGLDCTVAERARTAEVARFDVKAPAFPFTADAAAKQAQATAAVRGAAEARLGPGYRQLEACRQRAAPQNRG